MKLFPSACSLAVSASVAYHIRPVYIRYVLSFGKEAFKIQRVWTGHLGRKLFRRLVVAIEEFRFSKAAESNAIYKDRSLTGAYVLLVPNHNSPAAIFPVTTTQ